MKIKPILIILLALAALAFGQEKEKDGNSQPKLRNNRTYQLQFTFTELEDGKKINTRTYMVRAIGIERFSIREGSRVPITTKENQTTYIDVGLNISGRMNERENGFADLGLRRQCGDVRAGERERAEPHRAQWAPGHAQSLLHPGIGDHRRQECSPARCRPARRQAPPAD